MRMSSLDGSFQFLRRNKIVGFERRNSLACPVIHRVGGVGRARERMQLMDEAAAALKIRSSYIQIRTRHPNRVNGMLNVQVGIGLNAASSARGGDSRCQI